MSVLVRVVCRKSVGKATPAEISAGIAARLAAVAREFAPSQTDPPPDVLQRLVVDQVAGSPEFRTLMLRYHEGTGLPIRVDRRWDPDALEDELLELAETLVGRDEDDAIRIGDALQKCKETVTFDLKVKHMDDMGWPLALSAAAFLAERGQGFIQADGYGWMEATPQGLRFVLEE